MKVLFSFFSVIILIAVCLTSQPFISCTKEKTIYDTVIVNHHDTTIVDHHDTTTLYKHDTVQLTLESCCSNYEATVDSYFPTGNSAGLQLTVASWTHSGLPEDSRVYTRFDYSDLPSDALILSAKLSLYAVATPGAGNFVDPHYGSANACYVQRITSDWVMSTINWTNQPETTTDNQAVIPQSVSATQDDTNIDVTALVQDMIINGNHGFAIRLQNEVIYNSRQYSSSFDTDASKRPKLVIQYKNQ